MLSAQQQPQPVITDDELNENLELPTVDPTEEQALSDLEVITQENELYELIKDRACESQIEISTLEQVISKLIPPGGASIGALLDLARNSLTTPDDALSHVLSSTIIEESPLPATTSQKDTVYYIRSISMEVKEAIRLTNIYRDASYDDDFCDDLLQELEKVPAGDNVYMRYVGCTSATTPQERHQDDIKAKIRTRFQHFYNTLIQNTSANVSIHQLDLLTVPGGELGKGSDPQPMGNEDQLQAIKQHFNTLHGVLQSKKTPTTNRMAGMLKSDYIDFLSQQASEGYGLDIDGKRVFPLMIFGKDITLSDFKNHDRFFDESRAGNITKLLAETSIVRTLGVQLMVTLGYDPAVVAFSQFRDWYGLGVKEYRDTIGIPTIINMDTDFDYENSDYDAEPSEHWTIVVPHVHPGNVSYGPGRPDILRMMYLTWAMTFLLLDTILKMNGDTSLSFKPGSKAFAEDAIKRLEERDDYGVLKLELDQSREAVNAWRIKDSSGRREKAIFRGSDYYVFDSASGTLAQEKHFERYGYANGEPNSQERIKQVKRLQAANWSVFRKQIQTVYDNDKSKWRAWLLNLTQGTNIFQSALATIQLGPLGYLNNFPRPPNFAEDDNSWMNDDELVNWSHQEKARRMRDNLPAGYFMRERQQYAALRNGHCERAEVELFIKVPVWVDTNGRAHFSVKHNNQVLRYPNGITIGASLAQSKVYLDFDPSISNDALVVKNEVDELLPNAEEPIKIHAYQLKALYDPYYQVMKYTAQTLFVDDVAFQDENVFQWEHVIRQVKIEFDKVHTSPPIDGNKHIWTLGQYSTEGPVPGTETFPYNIDPDLITVPITAQKGAFRITNVEPFIAWWRKYHLKTTPGTKLLVDYTGETKGLYPSMSEFWAEFTAAVDDYDFPADDLNPYFMIRDFKKPQSLNKTCFDKFGWDKKKSAKPLHISSPYQVNRPPQYPHHQHQQREKLL
ncbi:hypothetical protein K492DRAFT_179528 [Lichtheimia hyalospora FSU 10163]|nr:hypothetical protein K492DRAFT_179528 [Lichtheimia hyalospora FSU 10163]